MRRKLGHPSPDTTPSFLSRVLCWWKTVTCCCLCGPHPSIAVLAQGIFLDSQKRNMARIHHRRLGPRHPEGCQPLQKAQCRAVSGRCCCRYAHTPFQPLCHSKATQRCHLRQSSPRPSECRTDSTAALEAGSRNEKQFLQEIQGYVRLIVSYQPPQPPVAGVLRQELSTQLRALLLSVTPRSSAIFAPGAVISSTALLLSRQRFRRFRVCARFPGDLGPLARGQEAGGSYTMASWPLGTFCSGTGYAVTDEENGLERARRHSQVRKEGNRSAVEQRAFCDRKKRERDGERERENGKLGGGELERDNERKRCTGKAAVGSLMPKPKWRERQHQRWDADGEQNGTA